MSASSGFKAWAAGLYRTSTNCHTLIFSEGSKRGAVMARSSELMGLSAALEGLREELETAWAAGADRALRFRVTEMTLTVQAVIRKEVEGSGKIRWWLIEAGGGRTSETEATQTLVLTLTPQFYDEQGNPGPLDVAANQVQPGR